MMSNRKRFLASQKVSLKKSTLVRTLGSEGSDLLRIELKRIQRNGPGWELLGPPRIVSVAVLHCIRSVKKSDESEEAL